MKRVTITVRVTDDATPTVLEPEGQKITAAAVANVLAGRVSVSETTLDGIGVGDLEPPEQLVPNLQAYADANGVKLTIKTAE